MPYVDSNLLNGEQVIYRARLHPIVFARSIVTAAIGVFVVLIGFLPSGNVGNLGRALQESGAAVALGGVLILVAALLALGAYIRVATSEFAVTNRRVLIKIGWLRRTSLELLLQKVEGIAVDQSVLGRMLDFGTIGVRGTGGSREGFRNIAAPLEFRRQVQERLPQ